MKPLLILAFVSLIFLPATHAAKKEAEIRARYAKQSAEALKLVEPIKVSDVFYYKDGGTVGIKITDAKGKDHLFSLDGRMDGTRNLYVGATHPTKPGAKKVDMHGPEESALYGVLLRWANKHPQREALFDEKIDLSRKEFGNLWEVRSFLLKLDARFTQK